LCGNSTINSSLADYRSLSKVKVGNGSSTAFWRDTWLYPGPIASTHRALFSHTLRLDISVQYVFQNGFDLHLRTRLTMAARHEVENLLFALAQVHLTMNAPDQRLLVSTSAKFNVRDAYKNLTCTCVQDQNSINIWRTKVPNKVKIFSWLFFKDRLSTRANLFHKNVLDDDMCQRCGSCVETRHHLFFGCASSSELWTVLRLVRINSSTTDMLWCMLMPPEAPQLVWPDILLTILWRI
jgi:hypothetical protein